MAAAALISLVITLPGCSHSRDSFTVLSYNVQNLFDATDTSNEYAEFRSAAGWNADKYYARLKRIARVIEDLPSRPDVIVMQEVENTRVVEDLVHDFLRRRYQVVAPTVFRTTAPVATAAGTTSSVTTEAATPIRVVIMSRLPIVRARAHQSVSVAALPAAGSPARDDRETTHSPVYRWRSRLIVDVDISASWGNIRLLGCHWKSQSGGERETEPQRLQSAALVKDLLRSEGSDTPVVVVGDFNEDVSEFEAHGGAYATAIMPAAAFAAAAHRPDGTNAYPRSLFVAGSMAAAGFRGGEPVFYSPWFGAGFPGSYSYRNRWERLDQALILPGNAEVEASLRVITGGELLTAGGEPFRFNSRTGTGYSDHLPILLSLTLQRDDYQASSASN